MINLQELEESLDRALANETSVSLNAWLQEMEQIENNPSVQYE